MFVRDPVPGQVKTRLVPALGAARAARLARAFTEDLCSVLAVRFPMALACTPDAELPFFRALARRFGVIRLPQGTGDLGARMRAVATAALTRASRVVLIGSDVPTLPPAHVAAAFRALRRTHVALAPSLDGGYHLLGLRAPLPAIFGRMVWSDDRVLACTLRRLRARRVSHTLLPAWYDVDTPADLVLLRRHLALCATVGDPRCRRTRRLLRRVPASRPPRRRRRP